MFSLRAGPDGGFRLGLFNRKPKIRFETITIDRELEVFRKLEASGYVLCEDPFQFDIKKPAEKLRKDAMSMAKDLHGELIVEIFDPIYQTMPWKGLRYAVWRKATPMEIQERIKKQQEKHRPNYKDTMGSYDEIARQLDRKKIQVSEDDLHALDSVVSSNTHPTEREIDGKTKEELEEASEAIKAISTFNPYDHQGEEGHEMDEPAGGPVFEQSIQLETDVVESEDITEDVDAMSMMQDAADNKPAPAPDPAPLQKTSPPRPPANVHPSSPPQNVESPAPPSVSQKPKPPAISPPPSPPAQTKKEEKEG